MRPAATVAGESPGEHLDRHPLLGEVPQRLGRVRPYALAEQHERDAASSRAGGRVGRERRDRAREQQHAIARRGLLGRLRADVRVRASSASSTSGAPSTHAPRSPKSAPLHLRAELNATRDRGAPARGSGVGGGQRPRRRVVLERRQRAQRLRDRLAFGQRLEAQHLERGFRQRARSCRRTRRRRAPAPPPPRAPARAPSFGRGRRRRRRRRSTSAARGPAGPSPRARRRWRARRRASPRAASAASRR